MHGVDVDLVRGSNLEIEFLEVNVERGSEVCEKETWHGLANGNGKRGNIYLLCL